VCGVEADVKEKKKDMKKGSQRGKKEIMVPLWGAWQVTST
jgi:hypothetical protein